MTKSLEGKHSEYFESIFQLRDVSEKLVEFAEEEMARVGLNIAKKIYLKNGIDYYLSDNNLARGLGKKLQDVFKGDLKVTATVFGRKKDREVYRLTILFREVPFTKGQIVEYRGDTYEVKSLAKDVILQNVKTGEKIHLKYHEVSDSNIKLKESDVTE